METMVHGRREQQRHVGLGLGLGLGLSLGVGAVDEQPCRGARVPSSAAPPPPSQECSWSGAGLFSSSSSDRRSTTMMTAMAACHDVEMPFLRGIDVNRAPAETTRPGLSCSEEDEETGASSPNSTLSSLSGKRGAPAAARTAAAGGSDDEDSGAGAGSRKKLRLSKDQAAVLEDTFKEHNTLNPKQKAALARQLGLKPRQVEVWFQNRRARTKLKQTEVDCELLKRCCETLTDENRRLHRELQELRALKLSPPHLFARAPPPTTLTMCPSCERLVSTTTTTTTTSAAAAAGDVAPARPTWFPHRPAAKRPPPS
ncbi:homeobox-leucine zipper protein HOX1-like [Oryza brachyantha]|uniref:homeobox-leucine zipper protein HOX1-like n=1 Tax=Oryza brachyantha TaxID=4533 RepID=UPI001AD97F95|nr:homeobox-leucine zipper protein HOX1-like [Oryza brachyantha]